eukprot:8854700-Alexandrium_andersonii.AAC.1
MCIRDSPPCDSSDSSSTGYAKSEVRKLPPSGNRTWTASTRHRPARLPRRGSAEALLRLSLVHFARPSCSAGRTGCHHSQRLGSRAKR